MKFTTKLLTGLVLLSALSYTTLDAQNPCHTGCSIQCIGQINVSLDQDCETEITPSMGAAGVEYYCDPYYSVTLYDPYGHELPNPVVGMDQVGKNLTFKVTETACNNSCWGNLYVEYKYPPTILCPGDLTVNCGAEALLDIPPATGGCTGLYIDMVYENVEQLDCSNTEYSSIITRTYRAYDDFGNASTCSHDIYVRKLDFDNIIYPGPATIACSDTLIQYDEDGFPIPWFTVSDYAAPFADGLPILCDDTVTDGLYCPITMDDTAVPLIPYGGAVAFVDNPDPNGPQYLIEELSGNASGLICNAVLTYTDVEIPNFTCKRKIIREWAIMDWWCSSIPPEPVNQLISIVDDIAPVFTCPSDRTVSTDYECGGDVYLEAIDAYDECGGTPIVKVDYNTKTSYITDGGIVDLNTGSNTLYYTVSDGCGNSSTCQQRILVEDTRPPVAICETYKVVSINSSETVLVFAEPFDNGSYDECGLDRFEVRRMDSLCVAHDTLFGESINFCCSDVGREVMVVFRAYDWNQNFNDCMVTVEVQDKISPRMECPRDITIECHDPYDLDNLELSFGTATINDNCLGTNIIVESVTEDVNSCGMGEIVRRFDVIAPDSVVQATCKQHITIENNTLGSSLNIIWPMNYDTVGVCDFDTLYPEELPAGFDKPVVTGQDECSLIGYQYDDKIFQSLNGCAHIKRTWRVIDWCSFNNGSYTVYESPIPQFIEIINTIDPTIEEQADLSFESLDVDCGGDTVRVTRSATDDCTFLAWSYKVINEDEEVIAEGLSNSVELYLDPGTYSFEWIVRDGCGNFDADIQTVEMINIKAPTPVCVSGLTAGIRCGDPQSPDTIEIWASDFDNGSSFSCSNDLIFSFSPDTSFRSMQFTCSMIDTIEVQMWVTDRNTMYQDYCSTFIVLQDNDADTSGMNVIQGNVYTEELIQIPEVKIGLGEDMPSVMTDEEGQYSFSDLVHGSQYKITPSKEGNPLEGVSTLDLIMIQRHILGLELIDSPYKLLAADINNDGKLSSIDLLELRKLILGIYDEFPNNQNWRFIDALHNFIDPMNPWAGPIPESYFIEFFDEDMSVEFIGLKIGDLNASAMASLMGQGIVEKRNREDLEIEYIVNEELGRIDFYANNYSSIQGWQLAFNFDAFEMRIDDISSAALAMGMGQNAHIDNDAGICRISYSSSKPETIAPDDLLFSINYHSYANHMLPFSQAGKEAMLSEAYLSDLRTIGLSLNKKMEAWVEASGIMTVAPNPWSGNTRVSYQVAEAGPVYWSVYDLTGRKLLSYNIDIDAPGSYDLVLDQRDIDGRGMVMLLMQTGSQIYKKRMLILE